MNNIQLAAWLHDNYEQLAKAENWQTQKITRVKFEHLPTENKATMLALADKMLKTFKIIALNPIVMRSVCCGAELIKFNTYGYDECIECGKTYKQTDA